MVNSPQLTPSLSIIKGHQASFRDLFSTRKLIISGDPNGLFSYIIIQ